MKLLFNELLTYTAIALLVGVPALTYIFMQPGEQFQAYVHECESGDDCLVSWNLKPHYRSIVRITGIDAPEGGSPYSNEARAELNKHARGWLVNLNCTKEYNSAISNEPSYRLYCDMSRDLPDGSKMNIGKVMVRNGYAWAAPKYFGERYRLDQIDAQANSEGLWHQESTELISPHCKRNRRLDKQCETNLAYMP